jgi:hypothetical protein
MLTKKPNMKKETIIKSIGDVSGDMTGLPKSQLAIVPGSTHVSLMMKTDILLSLLKPFLGL